VKVTDFGIARSLSDTHTRLTGRAGNTSGTLLYMSPQQLRGDDPAVSDDIYALGCDLYELAHGQATILHRRYYLADRGVEPKPVNARLATLGLSPVPAAWEQTIQACLAKDSAQRPQTAGEVAKRLTLTEAGATGWSVFPFGRTEPSNRHWAHEIQNAQSAARCRSCHAGSGRPGLCALADNEAYVDHQPHWTFGGKVGDQRSMKSKPRPKEATPVLSIASGSFMPTARAFRRTARKQPNGTARLQTKGMQRPNMSLAGRI